MAKKIFTYQEALASFPQVRQLTGDAVKQVRAIHTVPVVRDRGEELREELERQTREIVEQWTERIEKLGCEVKGLWLVDWDSGDGYYCWRYPEESLAHYHSYSDGFAGRVPIN